MSIRLYAYHKLSAILPEMRFYDLKAGLLRRCGFDVHRSARIVSSVRFFGSFKLSIGEDTFVGHEVLVAGGSSSITIGNACDLAPRVSLISGSHEIDMAEGHSAGRGFSKDIIIEDGVWIGTGVIILGGVRIGRKSVIAAGSVVIHDIPPYVIAAGIPCKPIKKCDSSDKHPSANNVSRS